MKSTVLGILLIFVFLLISCDTDVSFPDDIVVYENNFESSADISNWSNSENIELINGGSPAYGKSKSLFVKSGVSQPATSIILNSDVKDDKLTFAFWGKLEDTLTTATVKLERLNGDSEYETSMVISGNGWKSYSSENTFLVPVSGEYKLSVYTKEQDNAGVQIDYLSVIRIK